MFLIGVAPSTLPSFSATPDSDSVSGVVQPLPIVLAATPSPAVTF